jgi:hypothetical protein
MITVAEQWDEYCDTVYDDGTITQWQRDQLRSAFYAGAVQMLETAVHLCLEAKSSAPLLEYMLQCTEELEEFLMSCREESIREP